jgi:hypothetical protein
MTPSLKSFGINKLIEILNGSDLLNTPAGVTLVGIDEKTALVGGTNSWTVKGEQSVWGLTHDGREEFKPGQTLITN